MFVQFTCISFDFLRNCLDQYIYSLIPRSSYPSVCRLGKKVWEEGLCTMRQCTHNWLFASSLPILLVNLLCKLIT